MKESIISQVNVTLREDGNIAIQYNNVTVRDLELVFEKEYSGYPYLSSLRNYMRDLDVVTHDYLDAIDNLGVSD